jgi:hypothetical protein
VASETALPGRSVPGLLEGAHLSHDHSAYAAVRVAAQLQHVIAFGPEGIGDLVPVVVGGRLADELGQYAEVVGCARTRVLIDLDGELGLLLRATAEAVVAGGGCSGILGCMCAVRLTGFDTNGGIVNGPRRRIISQLSIGVDITRSDLSSF